MEAVLEAMTPSLERATGLALGPTYSYFRVYRHGDVLVRHMDCEACEASVTLNLGGDEVWPISLADRAQARTNERQPATR